MKAGQALSYFWLLLLLALFGLASASQKELGKIKQYSLSIKLRSGLLKLLSRSMSVGVFQALYRIYQPFIFPEGEEESCGGAFHYYEFQIVCLL